ncbi:MAG: FAD-dependent oxidoreductase, partial [Kiritimatiellia bacterium]|nr:FAD-dependent oxidoreductase [Kiritimatiellia bacterium]
MQTGQKQHVVVIGAGPGGYPAAFYAADLGFRVTLIDAESAPGGVCLHRGCIPSKALLHAARVRTEAEEAEAIGIHFGRPEIRVNELRDWKAGVISRLTGGLEALAKARGIERIRGRAEFAGETSVRIRLAAGGEQTLDFDAAILATGSRPATIPGLPEHPGIWDSTGALALESVPPRLLVIGGGYIGLELGSVYAALGSAVTVVEMLDGLLPGADRDLVKPLAQRLKKRMEAIHLKTRVAAVTADGDGLKVSFQNEKSGSWEERFDRVLVSVGRKPNSENLGLDRAGVER